MALTRTTRLLFPFILSFSLVACGGGGFTADESGAASSSTSTGGTSSNPNTGGSSTTNTSPVYRLGSGTATNFSEGQIEIGLANLSAGGTTGITATLIDQNNVLASESKTLTFTSDCISTGKSEVTSPVVSSTGVFTADYVAKGCEGDDEITATVGALTATGSVNVQPSTLGAVEFIGAEPKDILLSGMSAPGKQHTSLVQFLIKDDAGNPIEDADVSFSLTTNVGGIELSQTVSKTNANGIVNTIVQAGSVHTSVRVRATVVRNGITKASESSQLVIATGVADQNSFSLSIGTFNPAAFGVDGVEVPVNIIASDRYNNPVPDGTTVSFYTELGQIAPSCTTIKGRCSVNWTSSDPRDLGIADTRYPHDGITTVMAKVIGEESFIDTNSNGIFDDGDQFDTQSDKGEAFVDYNKGYQGNGIVTGFDDGLDRYFDYNDDNLHQEKDGKYTGLGCQHSTLCAGDNGLKDIFASAEIVMAESRLAVEVFKDGSILDPDFIENGKSYKIRVKGDVMHQIPPVGTTISVASDDATIERGSGTVPNSNFHESDVTDPLGYYETTLLVKDKDDTENVGCGTVKVSVSDANTTTLYLDYTENNPRVAENDIVSTNKDVAVIVDVLGNDRYPTCRAIQTITTTDPANGTATEENGKIKYTPDGGFTGEDTFSYTFTDGYGESATAEITVTTISAVNDIASTTVDAVVNIDVLANDTYPAGAIPSIEVSTNPTNGTATVESGKIKYTPNSGFTGSDTFSYIFTDTNSSISEAATVTVTVNP